MLRDATKAWHGVRLNQPDWGDASRSIALEGVFAASSLRFYIAMNAYHESLEFELPPQPIGGWRRWIDTSLPSPDDIGSWDEAVPVTASTYRLTDHSIVMLIATDAESPTTVPTGLANK